MRLIGCHTADFNQSGPGGYWWADAPSTRLVLGQKVIRQGAPQPVSADGRRLSVGLFRGNKMEIVREVEGDEKTRGTTSDWLRPQVASNATTCSSMCVATARWWGTHPSLCVVPVPPWRRETDVDLQLATLQMPHRTDFGLNDYTRPEKFSALTDWYSLAINNNVFMSTWIKRRLIILRVLQGLHSVLWLTVSAIQLKAVKSIMAYTEQEAISCQDELQLGPTQHSAGGEWGGGVVVVRVTLPIYTPGPGPLAKTSNVRPLVWLAGIELWAA